MALRRREIEELYDRRYLGFRNALAGITGSYESAKDVVQEAFAQALRHRRSFRGDGAPEAWIWTIALRIALRERGRRDGVARTAAGDEVATDLVAPIRDFALADAIRALPARRRLILFLHYFGDLSYEQIAEVCDISPGTVAATLAQARDALRVALQQNDEVMR
jgi:RNA polymerase sigma-70 factor, ECF subfamily